MTFLKCPRIASELPIASDLCLQAAGKLTMYEVEGQKAKPPSLHYIYLCIVLQKSYF